MNHDRRRWLALYVECLGVLMIVLNANIVNVALSSIKADFSFSDRSLPWIVDGYLIPYGGLLLLCGRLGDYCGYRRLFLIGIGLFTCASLICGLARSQGTLLAGRAVQGVGAAVVLGVALPWILKQFEKVSERAKAIGAFSFACACGGSMGLVLGGILAESFGWRWVFFVNVTIGTVVWILCRILVPAVDANLARARVNTGGAIAATASLMLATYAVTIAPNSGWLSTAAFLPIIGASALSAVFVCTERNAPEPLIPFGLLKDRGFTVALIAGALWAGAQAAWFYLGALYLQQVLHYDALKVGLAFLPVNLIAGIVSIGFSASFVARFGVRIPFFLGVSCCGVGLLLFSRTPVAASFGADLLPGMLLIGFGAGIAYIPLMLGAVKRLSQDDYGAASGVLNSALVMSAALSLAFFASFPFHSTSHFFDSRTTLPIDRLYGYHLSFRLSAMLAGAAALLGATLFDDGRPHSAYRIAR
jgi:EmrB/QacA subfamily drug resistance transporter